MATVVELPRLSDTMEEGVIAKWHVAEGDKVKRGQVIAEIETDKATMEFESFDAGTVLKLIAPEGETLPLGAPIAVLGKPGEDPGDALSKYGGNGKSNGAAAKAESAPAKGDKPKLAPEAADADEESEAEESEDEEREDEEDAANDESEAESDEGEEPEKAKEAPRKPKAAAKTGKGGKTGGAAARSPKSDDEAAPIADKEGSGKNQDRAEQAETERVLRQAERVRTEDTEGEADNGRIAASPLARRLARERGLELRDIEGSGPHGRIVKADVEAAKPKPKAAAAPAQARGAAVEAPAGNFFTRPDTEVKMSQMRKAIAKRMSQANTEIPHFYLTTVVDMAAAVGLRDQLKQALPDTKISFNDMIVLACAKALLVHPAVNSYWNGTTVVRRGNVHMGIAVAVDEGLVVPVIRFADQKALRTIADEARDLGTRARDKKLSTTEMTGSTFTVSNLGMFGIDQFAAVINPGEGAILAVGSITDEVVVVNGQPAIGKRMKMTLACDHRVMDGATGAKFLATLRDLLERPLSMLA